MSKTLSTHTVNAHDKIMNLWSVVYIQRKEAVRPDKEVFRLITSRNIEKNTRNK